MKLHITTREARSTTSWAVVEHRRVIRSTILMRHYDFSHFSPIHHPEITLQHWLMEARLRITINNLTAVGNSLFFALLGKGGCSQRGHAVVCLHGLFQFTFRFESKNPTSDLKQISSSSPKCFSIWLFGTSPPTQHYEQDKLKCTNFSCRTKTRATASKSEKKLGNYVWDNKCSQDYQFSAKT